MKFLRVTLFVLGTGACDKSVPDEIVNAPEPPAAAPGDGHHAGDGSEGSLRDAGGYVPFDASALPSLDASAPPPPDEPFTKRALLAASGACAVAHLDAFAEDAARLTAATQAFADTPTGATREAARGAFLAALASLERMELFRFGPAARAMDDPGGRDLRDQLYAYPQNLPCVVDQRIVDRKYETAFASILAGARGFTSLEYLLFFGGPGNSCGEALGINRNGTWAALGTDEIEARRRAYAAASAADVGQRVDALRRAWSDQGDGFLTKLVDAANGGVYASEQGALNAVSHGLFYLETEIKDWKLGLPLGLVEGCPNATCPDAVESRFARVSTDNLRQNLVGFRKLFQGCGPDYTGFGFDDWLVEVGAQELAVRMLNALGQAQRSVEELSPPLEEALVSDPARVRAVHAAVKALNDLLKTEFVSALNLELPMGAEGDND